MNITTFGLRVQQLKQALKHVRLLRQTNARLRALILLQQRARLAAHYAKCARERGVVYDDALVPQRVAERLRARGIDPAALPTRPGVLWIGVDEQQDRGGFVQSLERCANLTCFTQADGRYGIQYRSDDGLVRPHDRAMIARNDARLKELIRMQRDGPPVQLLVGQLWSQVISVSALRWVQEQGIITVNVAMDDRLPVHWRSAGGRRLGSVGLAPGLDLVLTTSPECCLWYAVEGCVAQFWPLASDPSVFVPEDEDAKLYDVAFVGTRYGVREQIVSALVAAGIEVAAFGPGWPRGAVPAAEVASIFARSRMILGVGTVAHNRDVYTLKLRDFDATMAGALYLTHRNEDLLRLYDEGEEIECYESEEELVTKVRQYLVESERRIRVAAAGRRRALRDHTWDIRFADLFATLRGDAAGVRFVSAR